MAPVSLSHEVIRFGDFDVDPRAGELRKHGIRIRLQVQPFQVLQTLLEHPGDVVTREELQRRIWPADTFVDFDQGLNNAVKKLREALGDNAEKPRFIETLSKRGYRFIGSVHNGATAAAAKEATASATSAKTGTPETRRKGFAWVLVFVATALVALMLVLVMNPTRVRDHSVGKNVAPRIQSVAVLPLQNLSSDPGQEFFSDGMTDALITDLAQIGSLKVISRTSSMQYKQTKKTLPEIARELNVDGIVEGTVQRSGDRVRITAQLIHGPSDKHLWANTYERDLYDVFALERDITEDIARHVQERIAPTKATQIAPPKRVDPRALEGFLQGNYFLQSFGKGGGDEENRKAAEYFLQAIDADSSFAPAYIGLAKAHFGLIWPSSQDAEIAKKAAERAVALDSNLSDAHKTLGDINVKSWHWSPAEDEYRRAIAINPNNADAHESLGALLMELGRLDEGYREAESAQTLDPSWDHLSDALERQGQFDAAIERQKRLLKVRGDDGFVRVELFRLYLKKGMYKEASFHLDRAATLFGYPEIAEAASRARAASGDRGAIRAFLKEWEHLVFTHQAFSPVNLADGYAALGDKDRAFYWLEQAYTQHDAEIASTDLGLERLNMEYLLDPLRSDPRFKDLVRRVGLPP